MGGELQMATREENKWLAKAGLHRMTQRVFLRWLLNVCIEVETRVARAMSRELACRTFLAVVLLSSSVPQHCTEHLGPGVSSMSPAETLGPAMFVIHQALPGHAETPDVCPACSSPDPVLTLMTTWFRYYRCYACGLIWSVARPGAPPAEGV